MTPGSVGSPIQDSQMNATDIEDAEPDLFAPWGRGNFLMVNEVTPLFSLPVHQRYNEEPGGDALVLDDHLHTQQGATTARWDYADFAEDPSGPILTSAWPGGLSRTLPRVRPRSGTSPAQSALTRRRQAQSCVRWRPTGPCLLGDARRGATRGRGTRLGLLVAQEFVRFEAVWRHEPLVLVHSSLTGGGTCSRLSEAWHNGSSGATGSGSASSRWTPLNRPLLCGPLNLLPRTWGQSRRGWLW